MSDRVRGRLAAVFSCRRLALLCRSTAFVATAAAATAPAAAGAATAALAGTVGFVPFLRSCRVGGISCGWGGNRLTAFTRGCWIFHCAWCRPFTLRLIAISVSIPVTLLIAFVVARGIGLVILTALMTAGATTVATCMAFTIPIPVAVVFTSRMVFRVSLLRPARLFAGTEQAAPEAHQQAWAGRNDGLGRWGR